MADPDQPWRTGSSTGGSSTSIHITALDGIVNVNSLFTLGVFLGLAWNPKDPSNILSGRCAPDSNKVAEDMVTFHVLSFSSFLFSSLVALCLKQAIRIHHNHHHGHDHDHDEDENGGRPRGFQQRFQFLNDYSFPSVRKVNAALLRAGILLSAVGSVSGCGFLMLALVNVVQIKLGKLGCSGASAAAVVPLVILVPAAMLIYTSIVFYAFTR